MFSRKIFFKRTWRGCQVPIGVNSSIQNDEITLIGMVASIDGKRLIKDESRGNIKYPEEVGKKLDWKS